MRRLIFFVIPLLAGVVCFAAGTDAVSVSQGDARLRAKADSALVYCRGNGMNTDFCLLVDMKMHAGRKRLWVWDFKAEGPALSSLCCHGCGEGSTASTPVFSNRPGSNCTSLGKYRLGIRSWSNWGIHVHYKMHGLETTNDNAFKRIVVLHSYDPVPEEEVYPYYLPMGWSLGCPVISNGAMRTIDTMLQKTTNPKVLLWIYR